jgi:hypothetical protein
VAGQNRPASEDALSTWGLGGIDYLGDLVVVGGDGADDGPGSLVDGDGASYVRRRGGLGVELAAATDLLPLNALQCLHPTPTQEGILKLINPRVGVRVC